MKYVLLMMSFCAFSYAASVNTAVRVYELGQEISVNNFEVIVGSKLEFVIAVDANDYWSGGLFISDRDQGLGHFAGRDSDPNMIRQPRERFQEVCACSCSKEAKLYRLIFWRSDSARICCTIEGICRSPRSI